VNENAFELPLVKLDVFWGWEKETASAIAVVSDGDEHILGLTMARGPQVSMSTNAIVIVIVVVGNAAEGLPAPQQ
jgi:hypothetical protein